MTETVQPGDVVTFTALPPNAVNRGKRYVITSMTGDEVSYRPEWRRNWPAVMDYTHRLGDLRLSGMTKAPAEEE